jgi:nitroreductase
MDRRTFLKTVPAFVALVAAESGFSADVNSILVESPAKSPAELGGKSAAEQVIKLNPPDLNKGISIMQALKKRKTQRDISNKRLTMQQLSEVLWAADGVNRPDGKRTAPAAMAMYCVDIYAVLPEGIYFYDVAGHELKLIAKGDYRKAAGTQDFVYIAPLNLVYVINLKSWQKARRQTPVEKQELWAHFEVGFLSQNVSLYCASEGLATTVRGSVDQKKLSELIKVRPEQLVLAQTIGYPKTNN